MPEVQVIPQETETTPPMGNRVLLEQFEWYLQNTKRGAEQMIFVQKNIQVYQALCRRMFESMFGKTMVGVVLVGAAAGSASFLGSMPFMTDLGMYFTGGGLAGGGLVSYLGSKLAQSRLGKYAKDEPVLTLHMLGNLGCSLFQQVPDTYVNRVRQMNQCLQAVSWCTAQRALALLSLALVNMEDLQKNFSDVSNTCFKEPKLQKEADYAKGELLAAGQEPLMRKFAEQDQKIAEQGQEIAELKLVIRQVSLGVKLLADQRIDARK